MIASEYTNCPGSALITSLLSSSVDGRGGMGEDYLTYPLQRFVWKCLPSKVESCVWCFYKYIVTSIRLSKYL